MTDPVAAQVALSVARHRLTRTVHDEDLARTANGDQVTPGEVEAELARIADRLTAGTHTIDLLGQEAS
ncbi:hypothetical protein AB0C42_24305 [Micromonospora taraxaci]|uniref:hypothetical protein n=1 Tax=Micromonospora taraxaci TaxID=1316803 RepID=UPI0033DA2E59